MRIFSAFCIASLKCYQWVISPVLFGLGVRCRFEPSCSSYALEAVRLHGGLRGMWLALGRLLRCSPLCDGGHDPVPRRWKGACSNHG